MKFTQYLLKNLIPEWIKLYLNFKYLKTHLAVATKLKKLLRKVKKLKPKDEYLQLKYDVSNNKPLMDKLERDRNNFMVTFEEECEQIYNFSEWKYRELLILFEKLEKQMKIMHQMADQTYENKIIITWNMPEKVPEEQHDTLIELTLYQKQKEELLGTAFKYYNECQQIQSYISLNSEGIRKILKKYKKQELKGIRDKEIEIKYFGNVSQLQKRLKKYETKINILKQDTESLIINHYYADDPSECRNLLRKYAESGKIRMRTVFLFGFFAGAAVMIILIILAMRFDGLLDPNGDKVFNKVFPCFRGMALFIIYYWFITLDLAGWNYFNINYKVYLGFNHHFSTVQELLQRVSLFTALFLITFLWYCIGVEDSLGDLSRVVQIFDIRYLPLVCWVVTIIYVFYPTKKLFNPQGRQWMYKMFYGALWGHFIKYESRYTFFTDQFTSMITSMRDFDYTLCYYHHFIFLGHEHNGECNFQRRFTAAQASIIPYFLKCIQYLTRARDKGKFLFTDEMYNFIKTFIAMSVGVLAYMTRLDLTFKPYWISVALFCSCFEYYWDLKKDFMFFEKGTKYKFLRSDLGYNSPYIYYTLGILNFFLRIAWVLTITPDMYRILGIKSELFVLFFGFLEMSRRLVNNFLKMEKEHINNLRSLKNIADLNFPFQDKQNIELEDIISVYDVESISTLPRASIHDFGDNLQNNVEVNQKGSNRESEAMKNICDDSKSELLSPGRMLQSPKVSMISKQTKKVSFLNLQIPLQEEMQQISLLSKKQNSTLMDRQFQEVKIPRNISFEDYHNLKVNIKRVNSFRLTQILEQPKESQINIHDYINIHPNMDMVEKAKHEEKLMQSKQKELKNENKSFLKIIEQYKLSYGIFQKHE